MASRGSNVPLRPPPPPRIRPPSPVQQVETNTIGEESDLSSVSDFEDEMENLEPENSEQDKLEEVSDSELEVEDPKEVDTVSDDGDDDDYDDDSCGGGCGSAAIAEPVSDLEDIESDDDLADVNSSTDQVEGTKSNDEEELDVMFACNDCNLLFEDSEPLEAHLKSEAHGLLKSGFKPSNGSHACYLCWLGHQTPEELVAHNESEQHIEKIEKNKVKAIITLHKEPNALKRRRAAVTSEKSPKKKLRRSYPPPLDNFYSKTDGGGGGGKVPITLPPEIVNEAETCRDCNLVFVSAEFTERHQTSEYHQLVKGGQLPQICQSWFFHKAQDRHYCFVCWIGYSHVKDLTKHYERKSHLENLKRQGVIRLFKDERYLNQSDWHHSAFFNDEVVISLDQYIVLDEVGESDEDEGGGENQNDNFDNVSSDEELNQTNSAVYDNNNASILEDVNSDDDVSVDRPTRRGSKFDRDNWSRSSISSDELQNGHSESDLRDTGETPNRNDGDNTNGLCRSNTLLDDQNLRPNDITNGDSRPLSKADLLSPACGLSPSNATQNLLLFSETKEKENSKAVTEDEISNDNFESGGGESNRRGICGQSEDVNFHSEFGVDLLMDGLDYGENSQ